ncbi:MAG: DUF1836 domain-containing protein [Lachnospiraceae bacterium]|nr:DUF1836 domain-containing protein [Lachnospiraceae bacterium]
MTIDDKDLLNSILASLSRIDYIKPDSIPNLDLYMDQITTFMDTQLAACRRYPEDKILTKTMINNYAKNDLLPPPVKKKYSKEHVLLLIFIYYFKNILSIGDIQEILNPLTEKYFGKEEDLNLTRIYEEVFSLEKEQAYNLSKDITRKYQVSRTTFSDTEGDDQEYLQNFAFICMLSFDVFVKKMLIEKLIDLEKAKQEANDKETKKETKKEARKEAK